MIGLSTLLVQEVLEWDIPSHLCGNTSMTKVANHCFSKKVSTYEARGEDYLGVELPDRWPYASWLAGNATGARDEELCLADALGDQIGKTLGAVWRLNETAEYEFAVGFVAVTMFWNELASLYIRGAENFLREIRATASMLKLLRCLWSFAVLR
jgi:hypothetical protein